MDTNEQDIPQLAIDQVITSRGEITWNDKDIEVLQTASILKVKHYHRTLNKRLNAEKREVLKKLKMKVQPKLDLLEKIEREEENIALEMMKGLSASEAFEKCLDRVEFETWQAITLENQEVDSD